MGDPGAFLRSFVPAALLDGCGGATDGLSAVGRHFDAAILVADITGFTALTERFSARGPAGAEALAGVINTYFSSQLGILEEYGGAPTRFAGDSMIALWPAVTADDLATATWRAAACGLALQRASMSNEVASQGLRLRAGVAAGRVWAARVGGVSGRWDHVLVGDPVVNAGKAASTVAPGGVGVTRQVGTLVQPSIIAASGVDGFLTLSSIPEPPALTPSIPRHELSADLLAAFVPCTVAERAAAGQLDWLAEFRRVTVLFLSLGHFDDRAPDGLERLQHAMTTVQRETYHFDGSLNQVLADDKGVSFVLGWNLPMMAHEDAAARAVRASLALSTALGDKGHAPALGLATGTAFCGLRGGDQCREYAMVGAVVNRAARLMQASGGLVLCDETTARAAGDRVLFAPGGAVTLKGITGPVPTFVPAGEQVARPRSQGPLVGRERELGAFRALLDRLIGTGESALVLIEGEPGIGKSHLIAACIDVAADSGVRALAGAADAVESAAPYFVWRPIFRELLRPAADADALRQALEQRFAGRADLAGWVPLLGPVFAVDFGETDVTRAMTPEAHAERTRELLVALLQDACRDRPLVVFLDDGHWFDSASWTLAAMGQQVRRLMVAIGTRPLEDPVLPDVAHVRRLAGDAHLRLESLTADSVVDIVRNRLGVDELPAALTAFIHRRAAGNPFFSEQLAFVLRDRGHLRIEGRRCRLAQGVQDLGRLEDVPVSLEGVITGRVDSLEPGVQLTLKVASAIGRAFRMETLRAVHPMGLSRDVISDHLSELARHDLVLAESAGDDPEFLFKHVVLRDVVYALMTIEQRRGLHRAIARRLELQHADDLTPVVGLLAHHWRHTGEAGTAVGYLERAGEQAFNAAASEETIHLVSDAVGLTREHALPIEAARLARWYWWRGFAHVRSGHFLDANADLREGLSLLGQRIPSTKAGVVSGLITGLVRQASRLIVGTRAATGPARDEARLAASLYHRYMEVQWNLQAPLWSLEAVVQCLNVSDSAGESPEIGISYANAGFWAGQLGLTRLAEVYYGRGHSMVEGSGLAGVEGYYHLSRAAYALSIGLWDVAERATQEGLIANRRAGDKSRVEAALTGGANADLQRGRYEDAIGWLRRAEESLWPYGSPTQRMWCLAGLLFAHCRLRRPTGALVKRLDDVLEDVTGTAEFVLGHCWRARATQLGGTRDEALDAIGLAVGAVQGVTTTPFYAGNGIFAVLEAYFDLWAGASSDAERAALLPGMNVMRKKLSQVARVSRMTRAAAALVDGRMDLLSGARRRARAHLQKGLQIAERHGLRYEAACAHLELAHLHGVAAEQAARHGQEAADLFRQMGVPPPEARPA